MPTDPNHRALLRAIEKLTTQVRRIADTLADGTAQETFALVPPVVTDDDGAQTTGDDATRPQLMGDGVPLPWPAPPYKMCSASTQGAFGRLLGPCVLRYQHDGPVHQDASGTMWATKG
ncbi:hypothetical protein AMK24_11035 [Streptomyces sp. CB02366]|uniref:hypothetical protein n=2 Tax=Streptomyces TaxID=1883 RepID=UPI00093D00AE|nr:hypothetical protein [Streptomyces sp. CB02366]OKJ38197.1 hypothetical protein AMK24_11035 [Streptomyces sp. CB02366]